MATFQALPSNARGSTASNALEVDTMRSLGVNPSHTLQHPGFYYYMAAKCTEMRRIRFLAVVEAEVRPFIPYNVSFLITCTTIAISTIRHLIAGFC